MDASAVSKRTNPDNYYKDLDNNGNAPHPVRGKQPNAWNLYDMLGNVWQWTGDWYWDKYYEQRLSWIDPRGPNQGQVQVMRGGSFYNPPSEVRASNRGRRRPNDRLAFVGFRCITD